jgi:hypothetical protein
MPLYETLLLIGGTVSPKSPVGEERGLLAFLAVRGNLIRFDLQLLGPITKPGLVYRKDALSALAKPILGSKLHPE